MKRFLRTERLTHESDGGPSGLAEMTDVTRLVLLDHETLRRHFADLDDAQASGQLSAITAAWKPLADLLDLHAETEEQVFYPELLAVGTHAEDETEDAIDDHNKIRDAVRDAASREPGSAEWWEAIGRARGEQQAHRRGGAGSAVRPPTQRRSQPASGARPALAGVPRRPRTPFTSRRRGQGRRRLHPRERAALTLLHHYRGRRRKR